MSVHPVVFVWQSVDVTDEHGEVRRVKGMVPLPRFDNTCGRQYVDGTEYELGPVGTRSKKSHDQFFAAVGESFHNLPEKIQARWPTDEHLRKWILIETGWFDEKEFECPDEKFARRLATFVRTEDEFARILIHRNADGGFKVIVRRAKSQAYGAMNKDDFQASKKDVLDYLEHLTGIPVSTLKKEAGRHG